MAKKRVVVAMSGGVDSAVAALLLKEAGYEVIGVTMLLWDAKGVTPCGQECFPYPPQDIYSIEQIHRILDIPFHIADFKDEFKRDVIDYLCQEYVEGKTPNPCIACNQYIKFGCLFNYARSLGADWLATGHYARIGRSETGYHISKGIDSSKDQSYLLYTLGQDILDCLLFPLGNYLKSDVRELARKSGLSTVVKASSQDICFVAKHYSIFLNQHLSSGDIINSQGKVLGKHKGIACYTIGQRQGLGLTSGERLYVTKIEPDENRITVGNEEELYSQDLTASKVHWVSEKAPHRPMTITTKIRYRSPEVTAILTPWLDSAWVHFAQPQRAVTPGQAVVFYQDGKVLGGGNIKN